MVVVVVGGGRVVVVVMGVGLVARELVHSGHSSRRRTQFSSVVHYRRH